MGYQAALDHYITALPASPFVDEVEIDPENRFTVNWNAMFEQIKASTDRWPFLIWPPKWLTPDRLEDEEDHPPLFIGAPSDDFIAACHRDLLPLLEDLARRG